MLNLREFSPCLLCAMPQLADPNFSRAVILLAEFRAEGAFGVVVNRPLDLTFDAVQSSEVRIAEVYRTERLWFGGPVNNQQILLLTVLKEGSVVEMPAASHKEELESKEAKRSVLFPLGQRLGLANSKAVIAGHECPSATDRFKLLVGYAAWASQQLDQELTAGAWLVAPLDRELVFSDPAAMWERAIRAIGVNPAMLQVPPSAARH
ncbi:MAG: YqgE/AlgH family protein [Deltaproteobacteria bacterium]|nr:YqgE/AlgH family protein [Deltaproteobacteria bacterium]